MILLSPIAGLGRSTLATLGAIGRVALYFAQAVSHILRPPWYPREFLVQIVQIGWLSLPVVGLTALFTGGALALQIYAGGSRFNAETVVPSIVAIGIARGSVRGLHGRHRLHTLVELIGRWSMIDVFVVAVLAALIQLGFLASVAPGPAAAPFALSVVLTMLAAQRLDARLIWIAADGRAR